MSRWVVVLAGGVGSRFWPLSTAQRPKQLLPLVTGKSLLADTLDRVRPIAPADRTLVLTSRSLVDAIAEAAAGVPRDNIIAEPQQAGTAAALAWAALEVERRDPGGTMICVHADWAIADAAGFRAALLEAAAVAEKDDVLVTVGVVPTRPDPGLGYSQPGGKSVRGTRRVERFIEKPSRADAAKLIEQGALWNSGIFAWRSSVFLEEVRARCPEVAGALDAAGAQEFFAGTKPISVDHGVLERSDRVRVLAGDFGWDDIGTWAALLRAGPTDADGNALHGDVEARDSSGNVVHTEAGTVVLYGVENLVVVARDGVTLVTTTERSADLKKLVEDLPAALRDRS